MKSIYTYIIILLFFAGCSKISDKEYINKAEESLKQNDIASAIEAYESLLDEYPESELAPGVLEKLATIYQNNQVKNLSKIESLKEASKLYRKIYDKYPESKDAAKALFMSGYILANDPVKDYEQATKTYKLFLEKFPNNDLADDAKEEIKNMGISAEEILGRNL